MSSAIELLIMHHENMRILYPDEELMVLCECEGTLYDRRALALHALRAFDRAHTTSFFSRAGLEQLPLPLPDIEELLGRLSIPYGISSTIADWYRRNLWTMDGIRHAHRPLANVLTVLTCLQLQDRTHIGLCAERDGTSEEAFAAMVDRLGHAISMRCAPEKVFLDDAPATQAPDRTLRAWHHFRNRGYRIIAVIDGRAEAGQAHMVSLDRSIEVLFLQARAVREMRSIDIPPRALNGPDFTLWDMLNSRLRTRTSRDPYAFQPGTDHVQAAVS